MCESISLAFQSSRTSRASWRVHPNTQSRLCTNAASIQPSAIPPVRSPAEGARLLQKPQGSVADALKCSVNSTVSFPTASKVSPNRHILNILETSEMIVGARDQMLDELPPPPPAGREESNDGCDKKRG